MSIASPEGHHTATTTWAACLLSLSAGAVDAFAFLSLGGIFTANMTGNLILAGMFTRPEFGTTLLGAGAAIASFAATLYLAFRIAAARRGSASTLLLASILAQGVVLAAVLWTGLGDTGVRIVVIALSAAGLALQTAAVRQLGPLAGVSTTYATGTLTNLMEALAGGGESNLAVRLGSILALVIGAVAGTAAVTVSPALAIALPIAAGLAALALIRLGGAGDRAAKSPA